MMGKMGRFLDHSLESAFCGVIDGKMSRGSKEDAKTTSGRGGE